MARFQMLQYELFGFIAMKAIDSAMTWYQNPGSSPV
jgi:hypothetical protein